MIVWCRLRKVDTKCGRKNMLGGVRMQRLLERAPEEIRHGRKWLGSRRQKGRIWYLLGTSITPGLPNYLRFQDRYKLAKHDMRGYAAVCAWWLPVQQHMQRRIWGELAKHVLLCQMMDVSWRQAAQTTIGMGMPVPDVTHPERFYRSKG